jgi:hypothetical protein
MLIEWFFVRIWTHSCSQFDILRIIHFDDLIVNENPENALRIIFVQTKSRKIQQITKFQKNSLTDFQHDHKNKSSY